MRSLSWWTLNAVTRVLMRESEEDFTVLALKMEEEAIESRNAGKVKETASPLETPERTWP